MGVIDGQSVNAAVSNAAWISKNVDDIDTSVLGFHSSLLASGTFIDNIQRAVNSLFTTTGATETVPGTMYGATAGTIIDGTSHKIALTVLANKFDPSTGHRHSGSAGDAPPVMASTLSSVPLKGYVEQGVDLIGVTGSSTNVTSQMSGKTASAGTTSTGVVVTFPVNKVIVRQASGTDQDDVYKDGSGNIVYARITFSSGTWTLSYFVNIATVETAYSFASASDVRWYFQELFNPMVNPPTYSEFAFIPSENETADVVTATTGVQGKVLLSSTAPPDVASTGAAGTANGTVANADHTHRGVTSLSIFGQITKLYGDVQIEAGTGITATYDGNAIKLVSGSVAFQERLGGTSNGTNLTFGPLTQVPSDNNSVLVCVDGIVVEETNWSFTGGNIVFTAGNAPATGQPVYVFYLTFGSPVVPSGTVNTEYHTVTSGEATAKQFTLAATPTQPAKVLVDLIGGGSQVSGTDFTISGNVFNWSGLGLDGVLGAGDIVRLFYFS